MHKIFGFIFFVLASSFLHAEALTDAEIKNWGKAYGDVIKWAQSTEFKEGFVKDSASVEDGRIFSNMVKSVRAEGKHYKSLAKVLKSNGYSDPDKWADTSDRIMIAYMANVVAGNEEQLEAQVKQVETMMNSGQIPAQQKALMEKMLPRMKASLKAAKQASDEDKAGVARNQGFLEEMLSAQAEAAK